MAASARRIRAAASADLAHYLGYAGTLGAKYYDYILGDRIIIPQDQFEFYCEKVVWLPDSYMPTQSQQPLSARVPKRAEQNLPENGFVFCCFNAPYKLAPEVFAVWMKLLKAAEGSVITLAFQPERSGQGELAA